MSEKLSTTSTVAVEPQSLARKTFTKLIVFTLSLAIIPIGSYFLSEKHVWNGNSTYAALTAVFSANLVLVVYIIDSVREDITPTPPSTTKDRDTSETKKDR